MSKSKLKIRAVSQKKEEQDHPPHKERFSFRYSLLSILIGLVLITITLTVFWPVSRHEFINLDDDTYITENPEVQKGLTVGSIIWAFKSTYAANWHPLTWLSHMIDFELYGLRPGGHHFTNLLLHLANTLLLFLVLKQMTGALWRSSFIAMLFALHPLHAESVAWVAERKDVLSTCFWMLTMWGYGHYIEQPTLKRYLLLLLSFTAGLLSKPMLVTLPFVLLLLDYWPLRRFRFEKTNVRPKLQETQSARVTRSGSYGFHLVTEKIPLFGLSAMSSVLTFFAQQHGGAVGSFEVYTLKSRIANALVSYLGYIKRMIWPHPLAVFYPYQDHLPTWEIAAAGLLLIGITFLVIRYRRRYPYLVVGWLWYLGTLVPVIGLVQVGMQAIADRYTYIPLIGLFIIVAWGVPDLLARYRYRRVVLSLSAGLLILAIVIVTRVQIDHWRSSLTLLQHTLNVTANNSLIHNNLGVALTRQGKIQEAMAHFAEALQLDDNYLEAHKNLGAALARQGRIEEAFAHYEKALRIKPDDAEAQYRVGFLLARQGKEQEAIVHYREALRIQPSHADAHNNLGVLLTRQGKNEEAVVHFFEAFRIKPEFAEVHINLANCLLAEGKIEEAISHYTEALRIKPAHVVARLSLGNALVRQRKIQEAIVQYTESLRIKPDFADAHLALGLAYVLAENQELAMKQYHLLKEINPALANTLAQKLSK